MTLRGAPTLDAMQRVFWDAIVHPEGVSAFLRDASDEERVLFAETFAETAEFQRTERVEVYAEAYFYRLHDVLAEVFPILRHAIGRARFHNLVTDFLLSHPSTAGNLHRLGDALPDFVRGQSSLPGHQQWADLAKLELALHTSLDAADAVPLRAEEVMQWEPEVLMGSQFRLVPSASLVSGGHPAGPWQQALREGHPIPEATSTPATTGHVVWRQGFRPLFRWVASPAEWAALTALCAGSPFAEICAVAQSHGATPIVAAGYLKRWLQDELLTSA